MNFKELLYRARQGDEDAILEEFLGFSEGTDRIEIWHWFDENYPEGVAALMNGGRHGN